MVGKSFNMMKKTLISLLSFFMCINMMVTDCFGKENDESIVLSDKQSEFLYEINDKRNSYEKHIRLSDGSITAFIYEDEVNIYDKTLAKWIEINNKINEGRIS